MTRDYCLAGTSRSDDAFVDRFVGNYDDVLQWQYTIWLNLTATGEQVSAEIVSNDSDSPASRCSSLLHL